MTTSQAFVTPEQFLAHWQGHRRLTRRFIVAFPDKELFEFSVGGMRPFAELATEMYKMAIPTVRGVGSGTWATDESPMPKTREELLAHWDRTTKELDREFPLIPPERFQASMKAFGQWDGTGHGLLLYVVDNEIHHRAQASVYLRALGIEPPFFPDRS
jgi:uncharacterized damage-inducible protein DinB